MAPKGKENQNPSEDETRKAKNRQRRKAAQILVIIGIIDSASLVLWAKSEDFSHPFDYYIRWLAYCGLLVGCAFGVHKLLKLRRRKLKKRTVAIIWTSWLIVCFSLFFTKEPSQDPFRPLIPANDPFPRTPSGEQITSVESNTVLFFIGGSLLPCKLQNHPMAIVWGREITADGFGWKPLIGVSITNNLATVFGWFFDKDGKIVAVLRDNKPIINSNIAFDVQRPDSSTLIVHDQYDIEAVNLRYMRPHVFMLTGRIRAPDGAEALITKSHIKFMNGGSKNSVVNGMTLINGGLFVGMEHAGIGGHGPDISE